MSSKKHIKIVISDCHLGAGANLPDGGINPLEDFRKDDKFVEFLDFYSSGEYENANIELVINGDFFDMLQTRTSHFPYEILENIAVHKIKLILRGHPKGRGTLVASGTTRS
jgi:metallophosphoesterase superfamily enzyme